MFLFKSYISTAERREANRKLPKLMVEGLLLGGTGLGVLALIFEIAADAFSVAAYQTLLAIYGADGFHEIAILAFIALSVMLFLGIVPAYKAGAYLRPNAGGSGPLVEAIGPPRLRWLSWVGTSLFFLDATLTIIISAISAADVTMLIFPEFAPWRILLAEGYAFFIMAVLVLIGPKRAVPLFLLGGAAFTIFTIIALTVVTISAIGNPDWGFLTEGIVYRLEESGVVDHVIRAAGELPAIGSVLFFQLFFRSMSSAMLGFSGYEVIPASGKHAAYPKWKVINTALTLAAAFLIGTGVLQLWAAQQWRIPSTEGYSTLLIEYEIVAVQTFSGGIAREDIVVTDEDRATAAQIMEGNARQQQLPGEPGNGEVFGVDEQSPEVAALAFNIATARAINERLPGTTGSFLLTMAGALLAIILLLAQGGGYVGGAAVAANAARLGRLPLFFENDRIGVAVIWGFAAIFIPIIREVVVVESFYAFGFVSAFMISSTAVFFVRDDVLRERGIDPGSDEAKSLRFAGFRGMLASYIMGIVLVATKTDALIVIALSGAILAIMQVYVSRGGLRLDEAKLKPVQREMGIMPVYASGFQRAQDETRQRAVADVVNSLIEEGRLLKFHVEPDRIRRLISYTHNVREEHFYNSKNHYGERIMEPCQEQEEIYQEIAAGREQMVRYIEDWSHFGIFTFVDNFHRNWVNMERGRDPAAVQKVMVSVLFPLTPRDEIWEEFSQHKWQLLPEAIWQFCRQRYEWAKDQWPNLSARITTVWTLQDLNLLGTEVDIETVVPVNMDPADVRLIETHTVGSESDVKKTQRLEPGRPPKK